MIVIVVEIARSIFYNSIYKERIWAFVLYDRRYLCSWTWEIKIAVEGKNWKKKTHCSIELLNQVLHPPRIFFAVMLHLCRGSQIFHHYYRTFKASGECWYYYLSSCALLDYYVIAICEWPLHFCITSNFFSSDSSPLGKSLHEQTAKVHMAPNSNWAWVIYACPFDSCNYSPCRSRSFNVRAWGKSQSVSRMQINQMSLVSC